MVRGDCRCRRGRRGRGCLAGHCGGSSSDAAEECSRCQYAGCGFGSPAHVHWTFFLWWADPVGPGSQAAIPARSQRETGRQFSSGGRRFTCLFWVATACTCRPRTSPPPHPRCVLYLLISPCRPISRRTTDSLRPIEAAMSSCSMPVARPREISSLSAKVSIVRRTLPPIQLARPPEPLTPQDHPRGNLLPPLSRDRPFRPIALDLLQSSLFLRFTPGYTRCRKASCPVWGSTSGIEYRARLQRFASLPSHAPATVDMN